MANDETAQLDLLQLDIEDIMRLMIGLTSSKSLQYLGVPMEPDKEPQKDLKKARLAIDCTGFLAEKLEPYLPEEENKQLKAMISNLQLAFIKES